MGDRLNAEPFYAALGFSTVEHLDIVVGNGATMPSLHMRRALGPVGKPTP